jgi:hypothetical protein
MMSLRSTILLAVALLLQAGPALPDQSTIAQLEVWKSPTCDCCGKWAKHMKARGFDVEVKEAPYAVLAKIKRQAGLGEQLASCHTAKIDGYVIEGHVPADDVKRLLQERPDAVGLAVPGMPVGSPGMEYGDEKEPYEVLLVKKDGSTEVFSRRGQ